MYSQAKVIAGGLAHIPVVIAVFYFILTTFNKRALKFVEEAKTKKPEAKAVENMQMFQSIFTVLKHHMREQLLKTIVFSKKEQLVELIT